MYVRKIAIFWLMHAVSSVQVFVASVVHFFWSTIDDYVQVFLCLLRLTALVLVLVWMRRTRSCYDPNAGYDSFKYLITDI